MLDLADALCGTRVIELDHPRRLAAAFCAKNLADLGADVAKLEDPAVPGVSRVACFADGIPPDPETAPLHLYLDAGKRSVDAGSLQRLLPEADLLVVAHQPAELAALGLDLDAIRAQHPRLSIVSVTPFGRTGPDRDRPATDLVLWAESGHMYMTGDADRMPLRHGWQFCDYVLGLTGALAAVTVVRGVTQGGPAQIADVAAIEVLVKCLEDAVVLPVGCGTERGRCGNRYYSTGDFLDLFRCSDGFVMNTSFTEKQWEALCHLVEHAEWPDDPDLAQWSGRIARQDALVGAIASWMSAHGRDEVMAAAQGMRIPLMKALRPDEVARDPQVIHSGTFADVDHPTAGRARCVRFPAHGPASRETPAPAPSAAEHASDVWGERDRAIAIGKSSAAPLAGVRVLDLTQVYAGPMSTALLADLGADVIKVESAGHMDVLRYIASTGEDAESSWWFQWVNRGKRSVAIELATPEGRDTMLSLAAHCDVIISNFGARALPKLGLGADVLRAAAPQAVIVAMPPFASSGPYRDYTSYGEALEFMTGVPWVSGYADDDRPMRAGAALCDSVASITAALSVVAALQARGAAGTGGHIDVSQHEAYLRLHGDLFVGDRVDYRHWGNRQPGYVFQGCAQTTDGWITVSAVDRADAARLRFVIGVDVPDEALTSNNADDPRWDALDRAFASWAGAVSTERARRILLDAGLPAAAVVRPGDLLAAEQLRSRGFFHTVAHPVLGDVPIDGYAFRLSDSALPELRRAPLFGEHTTEVLTEVLGMVPA